MTAQTLTTQTSERRSFLSLAFGDGTYKKALVTASIVGTILMLINHTDSVLNAGQWPPWWKIILTYCVPYCVMTWGAINGKLAMAEAAKADQQSID